MAFPRVAWLALLALLSVAAYDESEMPYDEMAGEEGEGFEENAPGAAKLLADVDEDKDGRISQVELKNRFAMWRNVQLDAELADAPSPDEDDDAAMNEDIAKDFSEMDKDSDRRISEAEAVEAIPPDDDDTLMSDALREEERLRFRAADSDHDGWMGLDEFKLFRTRTYVDPVLRFDRDSPR